MSASVAGTSATSASDAALRLQVAEALRVGARAAFFSLIVLIPLRARLLVDDRTTGPIYGEYVNFVLFWSDVALIALLVLWAGSQALNRRPLWLGPVLLRWAVMGLLAAVWLTAPFSVDSSLAAYNALRLTAVIALVVYVLNEVDNLGQVVPAIACMVLLQAFVAVFQVLDQGSLGLGGLGEIKLDPNAFGTSIVWTNDQPLILRGYGLTDHPNILGGLLAAGLLLVAAASTRTHWLWAVLLTGAFVVGIEGLLLTFSRSGWVSFIAGIALAFGLMAYRRQWTDASRWLSVWLLAALVVSPFAVRYAGYLSTRVSPPAVQENTTLESPEERALSERSALARNTNNIFVQRPLQGVGAGALPVAMQQKYPDFDFNFQPAHLTLLTAAAETGLVGGFCYFVLLVAPWALLWWRRDRLTPELIGASGALLAITVVGLFDYYTWSLVPGRLMFWLVLALWAVAYRRATEDPVA